MERIEYLQSLFMELPPDFKKIENEIRSNQYTTDEITLAACAFAEDCCFECKDFEAKHGRKPREEEIHSSYLYKICALLLQYGLDPNLVFGDKSVETNIMYEVRWIDNGDAAVDTLRLLLEHGGNPGLIVDGEPLFESIDCDVIFDVIELSDRKRFDMEFRIWLLMIGYGATIKNNKCPVQLHNGYTVEQFKNCEKFRYKMEFIENDWIMHIIDKDSDVEIASL